MKKIYEYEFKQIGDTEEKKSPFAAYENEHITRHIIDYPHGIAIADIHKEILKMLNQYLVLTSDLAFELFVKKGFDYSKSEIQKALYKLKNAAYIQAINFETDSGKSAHKVYLLSFRGIGYLNSLGVRHRMNGYLATLEAHEFKKLLACNQLLIKGKFEHTQVAQIVLREPQNPQEKACHIFRPTGAILNDQGKICQFVEAVRRTPAAKEELTNKLDRMIKVLNEKEHSNIPIVNHPRLILIAEDRQHMYELVRFCESFKKTIDIVYSYDRAIYSSPEDFLYEYEPVTNRRSFNFFKKALAACF